MIFGQCSNCHHQREAEKKYRTAAYWIWKLNERLWSTVVLIFLHSHAISTVQYICKESDNGLQFRDPAWTDGRYIIKTFSCIYISISLSQSRAKSSPRQLITFPWSLPYSFYPSLSFSTTDSLKNQRVLAALYPSPLHPVGWVSCVYITQFDFSSLRVALAVFGCEGQGVGPGGVGLD